LKSSSGQGRRGAGAQGARGAEKFRPRRGRWAQPKRRWRTSSLIRYKFCVACKPGSACYRNLKYQTLYHRRCLPDYACVSFSPHHAHSATFKPQQLEPVNHQPVYSLCLVHTCFALQPRPRPRTDGAQHHIVSGQLCCALLQDWPPGKTPSPFRPSQKTVETHIEWSHPSPVCVGGGDWRVATDPPTLCCHQFACIPSQEARLPHALVMPIEIKSSTFPVYIPHGPPPPPLATPIAYSRCDRRRNPAPTRSPPVARAGPPEPSRPSPAAAAAAGVA
jgi:hypothetical protein